MKQDEGRYGAKVFKTKDPNTIKIKRTAYNGVDYVSANTTSEQYVNVRDNVAIGNAIRVALNIEEKRD